MLGRRGFTEQLSEEGRESTVEGGVKKSNPAKILRRTMDSFQRATHSKALYFFGWVRKRVLLILIVNMRGEKPWKRSDH